VAIDQRIAVQQVSGPLSAFSVHAKTSPRLRRPATICLGLQAAGYREEKSVADHLLGRALLAAGTVSLTVLTSATAAAGVPSAQGVFVGPNTVTNPYVLPIADGVDITSLLTVNDAGSADNRYELVGIPDGIGTRVRSDGQLVVRVNHELTLDAGITRRHGQEGAFVSEYLLDPATGQVVRGRDAINPRIRYYDYQTGSYGPTPGAPAGAMSGHTLQFQRFCSASMTAPGQFFNAETGRGTQAQFYFANEEIGPEGRAFAVTVSGEAVQLPRLGLISWENTLAAPTTGDTTVVMGNDDANPGTVTAYVGRKNSNGSDALSRAGLMNGRNLAIKLSKVTTDADYRATYDIGDVVPFSLQDIEWRQSGAAQEAEGLAEGAMQFNRVEDGAFDPNNPNDYYFLTTEGGEGSGEGGGGGLWRLSFNDVNNPRMGGALTLLLDGTEPITLNKPDNMTIDTHGNLLIQEDPGGVEALARILAYRMTDGALGTVAQFDPAQFMTGGANFLTIDEESSGIVDAEAILGAPGAFLFDAQVHTAAGLPPGTGEDTVEEYVENGQLLRLDVADFAAVYDQG